MQGCINVILSKFYTPAIVDPTQPNPPKLKNVDPTRPNSWVNPTHGQLCNHRCVMKIHYYADCAQLHFDEFVRQRPAYRPPLGHAECEASGDARIL